MRILFDSKSKEYKTVFGTLRQGEGCGFRIHIPLSCKTQSVNLIFKKENGDTFGTYRMYQEREYEGYGVYFCEVCFSVTDLYFYYFEIVTENECFSLFKQGYDQTNMEDGCLWQLSVVPSDFSVPTDFQGKVMYQIFPDRFNRSGVCDVSEKLKSFYLHDDTADIPLYLPDEKGIVQNNDFFGGNLKGIKEKLPYLKSLNVGIIYLNPIFKAYSNHRYDTADYKRIDELLGTEQDFRELCDEAHKNGIKIILDGVFSHTGSNSVYFDADGVFGDGAVSNPDSPYRSWFDFKAYPDDYTSWWGIKTLPCVDENNESYRDYIIRGEDSVIAHWLSAGADGFRLDVADELPDSFIYELRQRMKSIKPDSFLVGEVWEDASNKRSYDVRRRYFTDGELDSVMNYPFRNLIIDLVSGRADSYTFREGVMTIAENYPKGVLLGLMNILSTHDTVRILTALGTSRVPERKSERAVYRLSEAEYEIGRKRLFCASFLQFVLPGSPCIYYGDEIGTEGFEDPFCRRYFDWTQAENSSVLDHYRRLTRLKELYSPLRFGDTRVRVLSEYAFELIREYDGRRLVAVVNIGDGDYVFECTSDVVLSEGCVFEGNKILTKKYGFVLFS